MGTREDIILDQITGLQIGEVQTTEGKINFVPLNPDSHQVIVRVSLILAKYDGILTAVDQEVGELRSELIASHEYNLISDLQLFCMLIRTIRERKSLKNINDINQLTNLLDRFSQLSLQVLNKLKESKSSNHEKFLDFINEILNLLDEIVESLKNLIKPESLRKLQEKIDSLKTIHNRNICKMDGPPPVVAPPLLSPQNIAKFNHDPNQTTAVITAQTPSSPRTTSSGWAMVAIVGFTSLTIAVSHLYPEIIGKNTRPVDSTQSRDRNQHQNIRPIHHPDNDEDPIQPAKKEKGEKPKKQVDTYVCESMVGTSCTLIADRAVVARTASQCTINAKYRGEKGFCGDVNQNKCKFTTETGQEITGEICLSSI